MPDQYGEAVRYAALYLGLRLAGAALAGWGAWRSGLPWWAALLSVCGGWALAGWAMHAAEVLARRRDGSTGCP
jgi:hypothetical protein